MTRRTFRSINVQSFIYLMHTRVLICNYVFHVCMCVGRLNIHHKNYPLSCCPDKTYNMVQHNFIIQVL